MLLLVPRLRGFSDSSRCESRSSILMCRTPPDKDDLLDALWETAAAEEPGANKDEPSHLHIPMDEETGEPLQARFVYVDEHSCIGCTYCATTARSTFFMEEDHGRARVYDQAGDSEDLVQEAIDSCPVNCIHYVSHEDLVTLEQERAAQFINNAQRLRSQQEATSFVPPTAAKSFNSGGMRCNNCPGRGCAECPMFGVGENPVYLERLAAREEKRRQRGEAQAEEEQDRRQALILGELMVDGDIVGDAEADVEASADDLEISAANMESEDAKRAAALDLLFGAPAEDDVNQAEEAIDGSLDALSAPDDGLDMS